MSDNPNVSQSDLQQAFESYHQIILPYLGGGGSGGSTYTLLFEGTAPTNLNTNDLTSSSASVELSDSIEHYDFIEIFFRSQKPFSTEGAIFSHGIMPVSALKSLYTICTFETSEGGFVASGYTFFSRQAWGFYDSTHISRCWEHYDGWVHNDNTLYVYGIKSKSDVGSNSHQYSTEEQVVGTWIDGKPIYEKSFSGRVSHGSLSAGEAVWLQEIPNCDVYLGASGSYNPNNDVNVSQIPNNAANVFLVRNNQQYMNWMAISFSSSRSSGYIDINYTYRYTKTTDTSSV